MLTDFKTGRHLLVTMKLNQILIARLKNSYKPLNQKDFLKISKKTIKKLKQC